MIASRRLPHGPARRLRRCRRGATIVEFALLAPVFLMLLLGLIETARALWTRQTLEDVAYATARCMAVGSACATDTTRKSYAMTRARGYGIVVPSGGITAAVGVCGSVSANRVVLTVPFVSGAAGLLPLPATIQAVACFPIVS